MGLNHPPMALTLTPRRGSLNLPVISGRVGSNFCKNILLDTGAECTMVHAKYVPPSRIRHTNTSITGISGAPRKVLGEADVPLNIQGQQVVVTCLVLSKMPFDLLLGYDFFQSHDITIECGSTKPGGSKPIKQTSVIRLPHPVQLEPHSERRILIKPRQPLEGCEDVYVRPYALPYSGVYTTESVSRIDQQGNLVISFVNTNCYTK